jgi:hypothetical protein
MSLKMAGMKQSFLCSTDMLVALDSFEKASDMYNLVLNELKGMENLIRMLDTQHDSVNIQCAMMAAF